MIVQASSLENCNIALFVGGNASESSVNTISIVIFFVQPQFPLQISSSPERHLVEIFSPDRADQSFDEWMRERNVRYCLDLHHIENPEIGVPLVESEQRVVVRAQISWAAKTPSVLSSCPLVHMMQPAEDRF